MTGSKGRFSGTTTTKKKLLRNNIATAAVGNLLGIHKVHMKKLLNNLPFLLPVLIIGGVLVYSLWIRELPKADGRITGDYAA
ncbi:MAG: hypothetical protein L3J82_10255, partial [Planctomycetes bacterium]|nr:hypothetical protein [Planctomycetota bacterium]